LAAPRERIIILDDNEDFRAMVAEYLGGHGYAVRAVGTGSALDASLAEEPADLILLDLNLPEENGLSIARRLKSSGTTAIVFLTGAGEATDRIVGLEIGADDYLVKPCDLRELKARIEAILRRNQPTPLFQTSAAGNPKRRLVAFGKVALDLDNHCLVTSDGEIRHLTASEHTLLAAFAHHPNRILSRDHLLELGSNGGNDAYDRSIDSRIKRIRKKIEINPAKPQIIKTVRSRGYIFLSPDTP
jgi:two-component system OmpR family response regulator